MYHICVSTPNSNKHFVFALPICLHKLDDFLKGKCNST